MGLTKCGRCGQIHTVVSVASAEASIREFNAAYVKLTHEQQEQFYNSQPARLDDYRKCSKCGASYQQMIPVKGSDVEVYKQCNVQTVCSVLQYE